MKLEPRQDLWNDLPQTHAWSKRTSPTGNPATTCLVRFADGEECRMIVHGHGTQVGDRVRTAGSMAEAVVIALVE